MADPGPPSYNFGGLNGGPGSGPGLPPGGAPAPAAHPSTSGNRAPPDPALSQVIVMATDAVNMDNAGRYKDAKQSYMLAAQELIRVFRESSDPLRQLAYRKRANSYLQRAEALDKILRQRAAVRRADVERRRQSVWFNKVVGKQLLKSGSDQTPVISQQLLAGRRIVLVYVSSRAAERSSPFLVQLHKLYSLVNDASQHATDSDAAPSMSASTVATAVTATATAVPADATGVPAVQAESDGKAMATTTATATAIAATPAAAPVPQQPKRLEIIFASQDRTEQDFNSFYLAHPWPAVPFRDRSQIGYLMSHCGAYGTHTTLTVFNGRDGRILVRNAAAAVQANPTAALFEKWAALAT